MANDCWGPSLMERFPNSVPEHAELIESHLGNFVIYLSNNGGQASFGQIIDEFIPSQANMYLEDFHEAKVLGMTTGRLDYNPRGDGMSLELSADDF